MQRRPVLLEVRTCCCALRVIGEVLDQKQIVLVLSQGGVPQFILKKSDADGAKSRSPKDLTADRIG